MNKFDLAGITDDLYCNYSNNHSDNRNKKKKESKNKN